ncbi:carboxylate-amine ligase [Paracoccus tegillarcae]|uniref:Putative glutamate--cysteine ligase 2 n=1 Tax=Paracoccus tegillarcae TaxID=1529068 RepID=A0A2K9EQM8_9RHOB|nr:carboxylate-amine ligase [Paracoccus tegillarcae]AUH33985.1 carboxylate-amine ligase [Paracoccus tegillarcae]
MSEPDFTIGIEEEYLLVDRDSGALAPVPDTMMNMARAELGDSVSPEFLRCQIEIGTPVCKTIGEARDKLRGLRSDIARHAAKHGLAPIAASCHPFANWRDQMHTDKDRYNALSQDLGGVARRMLICGMHVHVGIPDQAMRIDLMNQFTYFLPHLLAISASSPFWQGEDTGLASYRLTVFDNLPRTGLPPHLGSWSDYERSVAALTNLGVIEDATKIWWDLRPSGKFPTLETRICDATPRLDRALTLAALTQATMRMLWRLSRKNNRWRQYDTFLLGENRWRAQRYGTSEGLIDFGAEAIVPFAQLAEEWISIVAQDAEALKSTAEIEVLPDLVAAGTSADHQRKVMAGAIAAGASHDEALRAVVMDLIEDYTRDL